MGCCFCAMHTKSLHSDARWAEAMMYIYKGEGERLPPKRCYPANAAGKELLSYRLYIYSCQQQPCHLSGITFSAQYTGCWKRIKKAPAFRLKAVLFCCNFS